VSDLSLIGEFISMDWESNNVQHGKNVMCGMMCVRTPEIKPALFAFQCEYLNGGGEPSMRLALATICFHLVCPEFIDVIFRAL
jgi:hypothetical protein